MESLTHSMIFQLSEVKKRNCQVRAKEFHLQREICSIFCLGSKNIVRLYPVILYSVILYPRFGPLQSNKYGQLFLVIVSNINLSIFGVPQ